MICSDKECSREATVTIYWPSEGGLLPKCTSCAYGWSKVGEAMGFDLPIGNLDELKAVQVEEALQGDDDPQ